MVTQLDALLVGFAGGVFAYALLAIIQKKTISEEPEKVFTSNLPFITKKKGKIMPKVRDDKEAVNMENKNV